MSSRLPRESYVDWVRAVIGAFECGLQWSAPATERQALDALLGHAA